jgi:hypothetical protein
MKTRGYFLLAVAVALVVFMTLTDGYRGIVRFVGREAIATVVDYSQDAPGRLREGDWTLRYTFSTEDGEEIAGKSTFAPKARPAESAKSIQILYLPLNPRISEVKGHVSITGLMGYLFAIVIILRAIPFLRFQSESSSTQGEQGAAPNP